LLFFGAYFLNGAFLIGTFFNLIFPFLVIFGGVIGYSGDDINKFLWMVRIAEGEHPKIVSFVFFI